jgi:homocysteine S-methyltransferase
MPDRLAALLDRERFAILDGGLATELEVRGCDLDDPLWSAKVLLEAPDRVREVHRAYVAAGSEVLTTATYQATIPGLRKRGLDEAQARALLREAVALARAVAGEALVAASIGSYGAYLADGSEFRGDYNLDIGALMGFHRERLRELSAAEPDLLAFETIPDMTEAIAIGRLLATTPGPRAWVSFSLRPDSEDEPRISDGTPLREVVSFSSFLQPRIAAIGVNCIAPGAVLAAIETIASVAPGLPIVAYPNAGERWVAQRWAGEQTDLASFTALAEQWWRAGARLIGGCCRTGPAHIEALVRLRERLSTAA